MSPETISMSEHLRRRAEDLLAQVRKSSQPAAIEDINKLHHGGQTVPRN